MASDSRTKPQPPVEPVQPVKPAEQVVPAPEEASGQYVMEWAPTPDQYTVLKRFIVRLVPPKTKAPGWEGYDDDTLKAALTDAVEYAKTHDFAEWREHLVAQGTLADCVSEDDYTAIRAGQGPDVGAIGNPFGAQNYGRWSTYYYSTSRKAAPNRYSARQFQVAGLADLVPSYTETASQQKYLETVTAQVAEANRKAMEPYEADMEKYRQDTDAYTKATQTYQSDLADYEKWLRDSGLLVSRGQYEFCEPGDTTDALLEPAAAPAAGTLRITDPAPDRTHVGWSRTGGSDALDGWRADAQLVVDIAPVPGTTDVTVTAHLRGVAVHRDDSTGTWGRSAPYKARAILNLLARDTNGNFGTLSRAKTDETLDVNDGAEPVLVGTLSHTVPRTALMDLAVDWLFRADELNGDETVVMRGMAKGLKVLFVPPSLEGYRPGKVSDPASGERAGQRAGGITGPIQHHVYGHATVTTAPAKTTGKTTVTAEVYAEIRGMGGLLPEVGTSVDLDIISILKRYDTATDQWTTITSGSTRANKGRLVSSVTSGKLTAEVPTSELNLYRYTWRAGDTFQGGSYVEGALFPIYTTGT